MMSCNKTETAHISGTVTEKTTGQPLPNIVVKIERTNRSGMNSQTDPTIIMSTTTDQNGEYGLTFAMEKKYVYRVSCWPAKVPNDEAYDGGTGAGEYVDTKDEKIDLTLNPIAYIKVRLQRESNTPTELASFSLDRHTINVNLPNPPYDAIYGVYRVKANESIYIGWSQHCSAPDVWYKGEEYVTIKKGDTLTYLVKYK